MTNLKRIKFFVVSSLLLAVVALAGCSSSTTPNNTSDTPRPSLTKVRFGVSPFQDTLVPTIGKEKGWYEQEGLDVEFSVLDWQPVVEALAGGHVDVIINNISGVIVRHENTPDLVYYYGLNPFDKGAALMIRPNGRMKTVEQVLAEYPDRETALRMTALQLKGKTIITTRNTDMEQSVIAALKKAGLDYQKDVKILNFQAPEGLTAFLNGTGDAYLGGIPQRTEAGKQGMLEMLTGSDLGPPPINGLVTTRQYAEAHQDELLKILHVWFKTVTWVNENKDEGGTIIVNQLRKSGNSTFNLDDFKRFWNNYESYPASPAEVQATILDPAGRNYWRTAWDDCNSYSKDVAKTIKQAVAPGDAFWMERAHAAYLAKYGVK